MEFLFSCLWGFISMIVGILLSGLISLFKGKISFCFKGTVFFVYFLIGGDCPWRFLLTEDVLNLGGFCAGLAMAFLMISILLFEKKIFSKS